MGFIDTMRADGHAVESICRVLREQGCPIAARTYRSWKQPGRLVADRTVTDAMVVNAVRDIAWRSDPKTGKPTLTAEGVRRCATNRLGRVA
jgi:putative transposase